MAIIYLMNTNIFYRHEGAKNTGIHVNILVSSCLSGQQDKPDISVFYLCQLGI
jgi:hypothetical protein